MSHSIALHDLVESSQVLNVDVTGVAIDSRTVQPGDVFLAFPGDTHDGRQFIEQAVANGACAVIAEPPVAGFVDALPVPLIELPELQQEAGSIAARFYSHPSHQMLGVGVTGTNGKTTISHLVAQLIRLAGDGCGVIGTLGASLDGRVSGAANTTPDPVSLQRQLAQWRDEGVAAFSMEVSSHALVQGRVNGMRFNTVIFSNLSHDHLDYHGTMAAYGRAKLRLFELQSLAVAIVNLDDAFAPSVLQTLDSSVTALTYSIDGRVDAAVRVVDIRHTTQGMRARLETPWGEGEFTTSLSGRFNLGNIAAAATAALAAGQSLVDVLDHIALLTPVPGRVESVPNDLGIQVIVDYAHTPDALTEVLAALRPSVSGVLITVFGCGGDRDAAKRPVMGRAASEGADQLIVTSDNPRSENPTAILLDIEAGLTGDYRLVVDRAQAIEMAISEAMPGDCVLIAGKGHEDYQVLETGRIDFSDVAHAQAALARRASA